MWFWRTTWRNSKTNIHGPLEIQTKQLQNCHIKVYLRSLFSRGNDIFTTIILQLLNNFFSHIHMTFLFSFSFFSLHCFWPIRREKSKVVTKVVINWTYKYHYSFSKQLPILQCKRLIIKERISHILVSNWWIFNAKDSKYKNESHRRSPRGS